MFTVARPWLAAYDAVVPHSLAPYPDEPAFAMLERAAAAHPKRLALVEAWNGYKITFAEWDAQSDRAAGMLAAAGVQPGEPVALYTSNSIAFAVAFFGILKAGAAVAAVNPLYIPREVAEQLVDCGARYIIADAQFYATLQTARAYTQVQQAWIIGTEPTALDYGDTSWEVALAQEQTPRPAVTVGAEAIALYQYTGGTTGVPRAALGTHGNLIANSRQFDAWVHDRQEHEIILGVLPLFHVYGLVLTLARAAYQGATLVFSGRRPEDMLAAIRAYRPSFFPGVPTTYALLLDHPGIEAAAADLGSIRACISGAAPLPITVQERFEALTGGRLREGYGLSEAPTATHCNPLGGNRVGSIGVPLPDIDALIVDMETGKRILSPGEIGELIVRGPTIMRGYHNRPAATAQALREGWLYTGDVVRMDADGYFYIMDRKADIINCAGFKVYPNEVESMLRNHPAVAEVAVAGVPDAYRGEQVQAWVVLRPGASLTQDALLAWARGSLARYKIPRQITFVDTLPRSAVQKVLRRVLRGNQ